MVLLTLLLQLLPAVLTVQVAVLMVVVTMTEMTQVLADSNAGAELVTVWCWALDVCVVAVLVSEVVMVTVKTC